MVKRIIKGISVASAIGLTLMSSGCNSNSHDSDVTQKETDVIKPGYWTQANIPTSSVADSYEIGPAGVNNPYVVNVIENIGSGLYMVEENGEKVFYSVTDAGLAVKCELFETGEDFNPDGERDDWGASGDGLFCVDEDGAPSKDGKIYPDPTFEPKIVKFELTADGIHLLQTIAIRGTTIIPPRVDEARETSAGTNEDFATEYQATMPHNLTGEVIPHSQEGIDPEAIIVLIDGSFWIGEEFGPSLLHISAEGNIIEQLVPAGTENTYLGSSHTVRFVLDEMTKMRKRNRGIEAIAYDQGKNQLVYIMQNALANPEEKVHRQSNLHRMYTIQLDQNGNFESLLNEYVYPAAPSFAGPSKQKNVRISEMRYFSEGQFVVLERDKQNSDDPGYTNQVMYLVDVNGATDISGLGYDDLEVKALAGNPYDVAPVIKTEIFASDASGNSADDMMMPEGTEGFVLLNDEGDVVFISENEYGLEGRNGHVKIINIPALAKAPVQDSTGI